MVVPEESFGEDIGECVIFFVEVEDACVGCACCALSATTNRGQFRIMNSLRVSSFISTFFSSSCRRKDSKLCPKSVTANVSRCQYVMFKAEKHRCGSVAGWICD
jgi:hypothetical protein